MSQISKSNKTSNNNSIIKHMVACGALAAFVSMSVEAMPMTTSDDDENSISTKRASIPCVYDSCPEILDCDHVANAFSYKTKQQIELKTMYVFDNVWYAC